MGVFVAAGLDGGYQLLFYDKGFDGAFSIFYFITALLIGFFTRFLGSGVASSTARGRLS